jgi:hypothetical protein
MSYTGSTCKCRSADGPEQSPDPHPPQLGVRPLHRFRPAVHLGEKEVSLALGAFFGNPAPIILFLADCPLDLLFRGPLHSVLRDDRHVSSELVADRIVSDPPRQNRFSQSPKVCTRARVIFPFPDLFQPSRLSISLHLQPGNPPHLS